MKTTEKLKNSEIQKSNLKDVKGGCGQNNCISVGDSQDQGGFICGCGNRELNLINGESGFDLMECSKCGRLYCNN